MIALPCPRCAGSGWDSHGDRHTETIMDRCRKCGGTGQVRAATGERREASCDPATGRAFGEKQAKREKSYLLYPLGLPLVSVLDRLAKHAADTPGSNSKRLVLRGLVRSILSRRAELVVNPVLDGRKQLARCILVDAAERACKVDIGVPHKGESQTRRGFIRDRHHIGHSVSFTKHAPQTTGSIAAQIGFVKSVQAGLDLRAAQLLGAGNANIRQAVRAASGLTTGCYVSCWIVPRAAFWERMSAGERL